MTFFYVIVRQSLLYNSLSPHPSLFTLHDCTPCHCEKIFDFRGSPLDCFATLAMTFFTLTCRVTLVIIPRLFYFSRSPSNDLLLASCVESFLFYFPSPFTNYHPPQPSLIQGGSSIPSPIHLPPRPFACVRLVISHQT